MNCKMNILLIVTLVCSLVSCKPDDCPEPIENQSPIVWKKGLERSGLTSTSHTYNGNIIFGHPSERANNYWVYCLDAETGDSIWQTRIVTPFEFSPNDNEESQIYQDKIVFSSRKRMFVLNADNGQILWKYEDPNNYVGVSVLDGYIYIADLINKTESTMYRFDINSGTKEKLFTINRSEYGSNYSPHLMMPVKWVHPNGDEILVLQNRTYGWFTDMESKMDILAWNLTADSMLWYRENIDERGSMSRPAIDGNKVYFLGTWDAHCIDAATGNTLWKYHVDETAGGSFATANILLIDDKLIIKPDNDHMHAVNKETGEMIWRNNETASMPGLLRVHQDTIWFGSGGVLAIDANTGKTLIDQYEASNGSWIFPIAHHPTDGHIYTSDASYFYCLDPKYMRR